MLKRIKKSDVRDFQNGDDFVRYRTFPMHFRTVALDRIGHHNLRLPLLALAAILECLSERTLNLLCF